MRVAYYFIFLIIFSSLFTIQSGIVSQLPDYPYSGKFYSGYLAIRSPVKKLHYIFVESEKDPSKAPLFLWMNGGPGCSSLFGWAEEHGPAVFKDNSPKFELNPYSWNKLANIIYLESPAGVGFSYIDSQKIEDVVMDDEISGRENMEALLDFFKQYPNYQSNDFYISGESYAGIYVPYLALNILDHNKNAGKSEQIKLKGIIVGNGVADWNVDTTPSSIDFAYTHGLYSIELREKYNKACHVLDDIQACMEVVKKITAAFDSLNVYDIYRDCIVHDTPRTLRQSSKPRYLYTPWFFNTGSLKTTRWDIKVKKTPDNESQEDDPASLCVFSDSSKNYFNRPDVKKALHVKESITWEECKQKIFEDYHRFTEGSYFIYPYLIQNKLKILIYSGDTDLVVPVNGTQQWIAHLRLPILSKWASWKIEGSEEIAGYRTYYDGLDFVTIKGTGHMAPQWKPAEVFYMVRKYLANEKL